MALQVELQPAGSTCLRTFINLASASSEVEIVAATAGKKIRVVAVHAHAANAATDITFFSDSTEITCLYALAANGGFVEPFNPVGWFETTAGEALNATTSASGVAVGVVVVYVLVD